MSLRCFGQSYAILRRVLERDPLHGTLGGSLEVRLTEHLHLGRMNGPGVKDAHEVISKTNIACGSTENGTFCHPVGGLHSLLGQAGLTVEVLQIMNKYHQTVRRFSRAHGVGIQPFQKVGETLRVGQRGL